MLYHVSEKICECYPDGLKKSLFGFLYLMYRETRIGMSHFGERDTSKNVKC